MRALAGIAALALFSGAAWGAEGPSVKKIVVFRSTEVQRLATRVEADVVAILEMVAADLP